MAQNNIVTIEHLSKVYTERQIFQDTDFSINEGEKVALIGVNGTGKSTLLRIIAGLEEPDEGSMAMRRELEIRFLPQTPSFDPEDTILEAILHDNEGHQHVWDLETEAKKFLSKLGENDFSRKIKELSGGQKKRVALASTLLSTADLLILDEPTNHLDIASREWVEDALEDYEGALIFVSHDRYFVDKFATRVWELENAHIRDFLCGYQKYRAIKEKESIAAQAQNVPERRERKEKPKPATPNSKAVEKKLRAVEREVEKQEAAVAAYDPLIEAAASDYQELARLMAEKTEAEEKLSQLMEQWEALSLALEGEG